MKKNLNIFILIVLVLLVLVGCKKPVKLASPEISLEETVISWNAIENAKGYKVTVNDKEFDTQSTSYDLKELRESNFEIHVIAVGDDKDFVSSDPSNVIKVTPKNTVEVEKVDSTSEKVNYQINVQSNAEVLGFTIIVLFDQDQLDITEDSINWTSLLPSTWIYDVHVIDGEVRIALTGLEPINVRLMQKLANLEFTGETGSVTLKSYIIDND